MKRQTIGYISFFLWLSAGWSISLSMHWFIASWWVAAASTFVMSCCVMGAYHIGKASGIREMVDAMNPHIEAMRKNFNQQRVWLQSELARRRGCDS